MGAQPTDERSGPVRRDRDDGVTLLAIYHFVVAGVFLLATMVLALPTVILGVVGLTQDASAFIGMAAVVVIGAVTMVLCLLYVSIGYGLWTERQWGRVAALALAFLSLILFPIGTILGGLTLWHLLKPEVADRFR